MRTLVWFRGNDLRLRDHLPLYTALRQGETILAFVVGETQAPPVRNAARHRMRYLWQTVEALRCDIEARGSRLLLAEGDPLLVLPWIVRHCHVHQVFTQQHSDPDARQLTDELAERLTVPLRLFEGHTLTPPGTLRTLAGEPYSVFTAFSKALTKQLDVKRPMPAPARLPDWPADVANWVDATLQRPNAERKLLVRLPDDAAVGQGMGAVRSRTGRPLDVEPDDPAFGALRAGLRLPSGGERAALQRLKSFVTHRADQYAVARDRLDQSGTSRLSADLNFGSVSPRQVWTAALSAIPEGQGKSRFLSQLIWREFAHSTLWDRPQLLKEPFQKRFLRFPWRKDARAFSAWVEGRTGYPIVDAAARQLTEEGFVHNRARMIAASFLSKHLLVDFRLGERHYLDWLIDADRAQNDLGWQWASGCGCDAQPYFRVFNPMAQAEKFDPDGHYVRRYVPELARLPAPYIYAPWKAPSRELASAGIRLDRDYPTPIVDHSAGRNRFLAIASEHFSSKGQSTA